MVLSREWKGGGGRMKRGKGEKRREGLHHRTWPCHQVREKGRATANSKIFTLKIISILNSHIKKYFVSDSSHYNMCIRSGNFCYFLLVHKATKIKHMKNFKNVVLESECCCLPFPLARSFSSSVLMHSSTMSIYDPKLNADDNERHTRVHAG